MILKQKNLSCRYLKVDLLLVWIAICLVQFESLIVQAVHNWCRQQSFLQQQLKLEQLINMAYRWSFQVSKSASNKSDPLKIIIEIVIYGLEDTHLNIDLIMKENARLALFQLQLYYFTQDWLVLQQLCIY